MTALEALEVLKILRDDFHIGPNTDDKGKRPVSNKQLERWLDSGAIIIQGKKPKAKEDIGEPYWDLSPLVFFPKNPEKRITVL